MIWNNGYKRKKFEKEQEMLAKEYKRLGMNENQIKKIYEFDLTVYKSERRYAGHTQQFTTSDFHCGENDDSCSTLLKKYEEQLTYQLEDNVYWQEHWIEDIDDENLLKKIKSLTAEDIDLITKYVFENQTLEEIGIEMNLSKQAICKRIVNIKKKLK